MISILDIEASGFGRGSYPIEVGVISASQQRYCSLIKPHESWHHWCDKAATVHGISRDLLENCGEDPRVVCQKLNKLLGESTVYSDAWVHDKDWLNTLFYSAAMEPRFRLSPIEAALTEAQVECWDDAKQVTMAKLGLQRHRASSDALIIQKTFALSLRMSRSLRLRESLALVPAF